MDKECENFVDECTNSHTTVSCFIKLFNMWDRLSSDQRGKVIESEIRKGRLQVEK